MVGITLRCFLPTYLPLRPTIPGDSPHITLQAKPGAKHGAKPRSRMRHHTYLDGACIGLYAITLFAVGGLVVILIQGALFFQDGNRDVCESDCNSGFQSVLDAKGARMCVWAGNVTEAGLHPAYYQCHKNSAEGIAVGLVEMFISLPFLIVFLWFLGRDCVCPAPATRDARDGFLRWVARS